MRLAFFDDQLDNFHTNAFLDLLRKEFADRGHTVIGCHALQAEGGRAWAQRRSVPWYDDAAALARDADAMLIIAPSTPGTHPELCARVLPAGKPTYIDKPMATSLADAEAIFALADRHGAPVQSCSALRHSSIVAAGMAMGQALTQVVTWGAGGTFAEYAIHPLELAVALLGPEAERVARRGSDAQRQLLVDFSGGRNAVINLNLGSDTPYIAVMATPERTRIAQLDWPSLMPRTLDATLAFLASGTPNIDRRETLAIRRILDLADDPRCSGTFQPVWP